MKCSKILLFSFLVISVSVSSYGQDGNWELKKEKNGIRVFTKEIPNASLDAFMGVGIVNASMEQIVEVLRDGNNYKAWSPDCIVSQQKENTATRQVNYTVTEAPFPVQDRDSYVEFYFETLENGVKITLTGKPKYGPEEEDRTRIPFLEGFWLLEKISAIQTKVTYQVHADPGGSIPSWLANATAVDMPFDTIANLRDFLNN